MARASDTGTPATSQSDENYFYYLHSDHLGSSHILTEGNSSGGKHSGIFYNRGTLIQRIEYSPFGQELYVLNPNLKFDPRYTGQSYDIETGLYSPREIRFEPLFDEHLSVVSFEVLFAVCGIGSVQASFVINVRDSQITTAE